MRDPFPLPPPQLLVNAVKPFADAVSLSSLPLHFHEVIFAFILYTTIFLVVAPFLSKLVIPQRYSKFNHRTRVSWDVHVVSFTQSVIICVLSLYIILNDEDRRSWRSTDDWRDRIWAYSGLSGLCQSFALGYFLWDLWMCTYYVRIFGKGMLAHAISAVSVFALGYRPFLYFYCPVFLLYELSSPFLNIHWFCDKLDLTGSIYQAVNGAFLTSTFFCCRICWGLYSSFNVFHDIYSAIQAGHSRPSIFVDDESSRNSRSGDISLYSASIETQRTAFMGAAYVPLWLACAYLASNLVLNCLNIYWFGKMIDTIRKRFDPPFGTKGVGASEVGRKTAGKSNRDKAATDVHTDVSRGIYEDGHKSVEVTGSTRTPLKPRRKA
nr:putative tlc domain-containing protein c17a2.02c [Quercus suber]